MTPSFPSRRSSGLATSDGFDFGEFGHGGGVSLIAAWLLQERREPQPAESGVDLRRVVDDAADQAVFLGLLRAHPEIAFGIAAHAFDRLAGLAREDFVEALTHHHDFLGTDRNIRRGAAGTTGRPIGKE